MRELYHRDLDRSTEAILPFILDYLFDFEAQNQGANFIILFVALRYSGVLFWRLGTLVCPSSAREGSVCV